MIDRNLNEIKTKIAQAAKKAQKNPEEITLIAVSKTYPVSAIESAIMAGCHDFGENKVQELTNKIENIKTPVNWHLIGHLQTNKVKYVVGKVALIHSVDSLKLAKEIQKESMKKNVETNILLEVNVAKESSKDGFFVEEVLDVIKEIATFSHVKLRGLMTVAPYVKNSEDNRKIFQKLSNLLVDIQKQNIDNISVNILSMGMSNDYEIAIEEGANMVRVGTAIFGERNYD
ncbi:MAG: YggS family pyridoxal phosphate-dependent enzyme [Cellulosilyticaceae bacterium]